MKTTEWVIFFDGYCGLCNGFVDFVMRHDREGKFFFSPLQSDYSRTHLAQEDVTDLKSVVVQYQGKTYKKSEAVMRVLAAMGTPWKQLSILRVLPDFLLNGGYDLVASNRYRIFGKRETCRLPTENERKRFIL